MNTSAYPPAGSPSDFQSPSASLLVTEEQANIGRRVEVTGGVRVRIEAETVPTQVPVTESQTHVHIERRRLGVPADERRPAHYDGDVLVVPVYEVVTVVAQQLVLKEEIRIRQETKVSETHEEVLLQRERAVVERLRRDGTWTEDNAS